MSNLSTSHTHIHIPTYVVFWAILVSVVVIEFQMQSDHLAYNEYITYRDIYVDVTCGQLVMRLFLNTFHPYLVPILSLTSQSSLHFLCTSFLMAFGYLKWFEFATTSIHMHSIKHLCSFVCLVFHFRYTPKNKKQRGKLERSSLKHCLSVSALVTQVVRHVG